MTCKKCKAKTGHKLDCPVLKENMLDDFETMYYNSFRLQGLLPSIRPVKINFTPVEYKKIMKVIDKGWANFKLQLKKII